VHNVNVLSAVDTAYLQPQAYLLSQAPHCGPVRAKDAAQQLHADGRRLTSERRTAAEGPAPGAETDALPAAVRFDKLASYAALSAECYRNVCADCVLSSAALIRAAYGPGRCQARSGHYPGQAGRPTAAAVVAGIQLAADTGQYKRYSQLKAAKRHNMSLLLLC